MLGIVFEPSFLDLSSAGIHETIHNIIIIKCYVDMHKDMYVMSSYMYQVTPHQFRGMARYMQKDIITQAPPATTTSSYANTSFGSGSPCLLLPPCSNILSANRNTLKPVQLLLIRNVVVQECSIQIPQCRVLYFFVKLTAIRLLSIDNLFREENENYRRITTLAS